MKLVFKFLIVGVSIFVSEQSHASIVNATDFYACMSIPCTPELTYSSQAELRYDLFGVDNGTKFHCGYCVASLDTPPPATSPKPNQCPALRSGSIVNVDSQILGESIELVGAPFKLFYYSDRVMGRSRDYQLKVPLTPATPVSDLVSIDLTINYGSGLSFAQNFPVAPNLSYTFQWDGKDSSGQMTEGGVAITYSLKENRTSVATSPLPFTGRLGGYKAILNGLGGWTIGVHHFYDHSLKRLYFGSGGSREVDALATTSGSFRVASEDASEVYLFSASGKHLSTLYGLTGSAKYTFTYDTSNRLSSITDSYTQQYLMVRDTSGTLTGFQAPHGQLTSFAINANGYLSQVTNPDWQSYVITYQGSGGLMSGFQTPAGKINTFTYSSDGSLTSDISNSGSSLSLATTPQFTGASVAVTDSVGLITTYNIHSASGNEEQRSFTTPSGENRGYYSWRGANRNDSRLSYSRSRSFVNDPRFGKQANYVGSEYEMVGQSRSTSRTVSSILNGAGTDPFDISSLTETVSVNSLVSTTVYEGTLRKFTTTSPEGRKRYVILDAKENVTSVQNGSLAATQSNYDTSGKLVGRATGARTTVFSYLASGFLGSVSNALNQVTSFTYDLAGRVATVTLPDSRVVTYLRDASGNITSVSPPSSAAHTFSFNLNNMMTSYGAPSLGAGVLTNSMSFDGEKRITQITRPNGDLIGFTYGSTTGFLDSMHRGSNIINYNRFQDGRIYNASSPDGVNLYNTWSGQLPTGNSYSYGGVNVSISMTNNNFYLPASFQIGSGASHNWTYDNDQLLIKTGDQDINRTAGTGLVSGTAISNATETYTYDPVYGEPSGYVAKYGSTTYRSETITRDLLGRITSRLASQGPPPSKTWGYVYDSAGRLTDVTKNANPYSTYTYDANSNRTSATRLGVTETATFDAQDRMLTHGSRSYSYNLNGERISEVDSSVTPGTTSYTWDAWGNLKSVTLPNSLVVSYKYDGFNRRSIKLNGSAVSERFLYLTQEKIAAVLNASGATVMTFFYGERNTPEYMIKSGSEYKFFVDHVGSVRQVVKVSDGSIAQEMVYDEFGRMLTDTNPGFQPFGFAGGLYDQDTELTQFGARWYDAEVGRWLSKDPILFAGGDTNLYGYVLNDPVNLIDVNGKHPIAIAAVIGGGAFVGGFASSAGTYWATGSASQARSAFIPGAIGGAVAMAGPIAGVAFGTSAIAGTWIGLGIDIGLNLSNIFGSIPDGSEKDVGKGLGALLQNKSANQCD